MAALAMKPRAIPRTRRWCSCMASAARRGRGAAQLDFFGGRYRAIAWDMPGYGGSAPLTAVSIASLADALRDFLQQLGATKPILVGHSIGGMIVQQLLATKLRHRQRRRSGANQPGIRQARRRLAEILSRRPARPARSRRNDGFAGADFGEGIGRRRSRRPAAWSLPATAWPPFPRPPIAPPCWR